MSFRSGIFGGGVYYSYIIKLSIWQVIVSQYVSQPFFIFPVKLKLYASICNSDFGSKFIIEIGIMSDKIVNQFMAEKAGMKAVDKA